MGHIDDLKDKSQKMIYNAQQQTAKLSKKVLEEMTIQVRDDIDFSDLKDLSGSPSKAMNLPQFDADGQILPTSISPNGKGHLNDRNSNITPNRRKSPARMRNEFLSQQSAVDTSD